MKHKKLLVICGPTATGKTKLALHLGKKLNGEIVSADSRQVYKGMDIGTGKGLPENAKWKREGIGFYEIDGVRIWGYDLVEPTGEFSVAQYVKIARKIIEDILRRRKLPILVGGTGFYIKGLVDGIPSAKIPKDKNLRKSLEGKDASELFEILAQVDPVKAALLNMSDKKNPRRLVRAIEVTTHYKRFKKKVASMNQFIEEDKVLFVGLTLSKKYLDKRIEKRVDMRVRQGTEKEIESLFRKGVTWRHQSIQALGYRQWRGFFEKEKSLSDVVLNWKRAEKQYVKRQMTWFKRDKRINWFDISKLGWEKDVERLVGKWYKSE